jgi:predicted nucleic acid-binding protein
MIFIDTNMIIWGIKKQHSPGQDEMVPRTIAYLKKLEKDGTPVGISSLSLAEAMVKCDNPQRIALYSFIKKVFEVRPFDSNAARIYGDIHSDLVAKFTGKTDRRSLKLDLMILAVAISRQARALITHDHAIVGETVMGVEVMSIPRVPSQMNLVETPPG